MRGGGAGAFRARALRGFRRHGRQRSRRRCAGRRDPQAHRRAAYSGQQRRGELGRAVRNFPLEGVGARAQRQRDRAFHADARSRPDADCFGDARAAFDRRQHGFGHGDRDAVGNRMGLFRLEGRGASPDPHPRRGACREAGDCERVRAWTVSDQHDEVRHRRRGGAGAQREGRADGPRRAARRTSPAAPVPRPGAAAPTRPGRFCRWTAGSASRRRRRCSEISE